MKARFPVALLALLALWSCAKPSDPGPEQEPGQRADAAFELPDTGPASFAEGKGPRVGIDEAHRNYHTAAGRYGAFAELLRRDGYRVQGFDSKFAEEALQAVDVLVISNALSPENERNWTLPNHSAFSPEEIEAVREWVAGGGRLMLIADHMPMPGAAADLAAAFGVLFQDGFAFNADGTGQMTFRLEDGTLGDHPVTGPEGGGDVPFVTTFTGQAFSLAPGVSATGLMHLAEAAYVLLPTEAWVFDETTPKIQAGSMLQGALLQPGAGRLAVFGEAAAFTAQVSGTEARPMGMNHPDAQHNARFVLNVMRWLSGDRGR
jgi:hypothetical protein